MILLISLLHLDRKERINAMENALLPPFRRLKFWRRKNSLLHHIKRQKSHLLPSKGVESDNGTVERQAACAFWCMYKEFTD